MGASIAGVFLSASRSHAIVLFLLLGVISISTRMSVPVKVAWVVIVIGIGWTVASQERLQRFMTLQDTDYVEQRLRGSINKSLFEVIVDYPFGNGMGAGGSSIPYFLQDLLNDPISIESEYGRIVLEQGIMGLLLWLGFITWALSRTISRRNDPYFLSRLLMRVACGVYFLTGFIGTGMFTSIPFSLLMLLGAGWMSVRPPAVVRKNALPAFKSRAPAAIALSAAF
jgi:hypothetical protein